MNLRTTFVPIAAIAALSIFLLPVVDRASEMNAQTGAVPSANNTEPIGASSTAAAPKATPTDAPSPEPDSQAIPQEPDISSAPDAPTEDLNLWGMIRRYNWLERLAFMTLGFIGVYIPGVFLNRWLTFEKVYRTSAGLEAKVIPAVRAREFENALETCRQMRESPLAKLAEPAIVEMKCAGKITPLSFECVRLAAGIVARTLVGRLGASTRGLLSASILAPLVGLLAAVEGAANAFGGEMYGRVSAAAIMLELSRALTPLAIGAFEGILAHLAYRLVLARTQEIERRVSTFKSDLLMAMLTSRPPERAPRTTPAKLYSPGLAFLEPSPKPRRRSIDSKAI